MQEEHTVERRRLLRRAGTVAAGVAGAGVVGAAVAAPAQAAPGEPVVQGQDNNAGTTTTTITNDSAGNPTLALSNTVVEGNGGAGPALRLAPSGAFISPSAPVGSLSADASGNVWSAVDFGGGTDQAFLYSNGNATQTVLLFTPQRVLDTRNAANRTGILNPNVLDSQFRVIGGQTLNVDIGDFVLFGQGLLANLTVVNPVNGGFVTVFPFGFPRPNIASINHQVGGVLSNFTGTAIGWSADPAGPQDVISIFCQRTTHIILDVVAFTVGSVDQILQGYDVPVQAQARAAGPARQQRAMEAVRKKRAS